MIDGDTKKDARYHGATTTNASGTEQLPTHPREGHGLYRLRKSVAVLGGRGLKVVDERTAIGKAIVAWRQELIADLGGQSP